MRFASREHFNRLRDQIFAGGLVAFGFESFAECLRRDAPCSIAAWRWRAYCALWCSGCKVPKSTLIGLQDKKNQKKEQKKAKKENKTNKKEFTPDVQNAADRRQSKQESVTDHRIQNAADFKQSKQYTKREVKRMKINGSQPRQLPCWLALLCLMCLPAQAASSCPTESPVACTRPSPLEGSPGASFGGGLAAANVTPLQWSVRQLFCSEVRALCAFELNMRCASVPLQ